MFFLRDYSLTYIRNVNYYFWNWLQNAGFCHLFNECFVHFEFWFNLRSQNEWCDHLRFCNERDEIFEPPGRTDWIRKIENSISESSTHRSIRIIRNGEKRSGKRERKTATVLWLNRRFQMYCCFSPSFSSRYRYIFQLLLICCFYYYYFFVPIRHKFYEASHFQRAYLACVNSNKCKE